MWVCILHPLWINTLNNQDKYSKQTHVLVKQHESRVSHCPGLIRRCWVSTGRRGRVGIINHSMMAGWVRCPSQRYMFRADQYRQLRLSRLSLHAFHFKGNMSVCFGSNACGACLGQLHCLSHACLSMLQECGLYALLLKG